MKIKNTNLSVQPNSKYKNRYSIIKKIGSKEEATSIQKKKNEKKLR